MVGARALAQLLFVSLCMCALLLPWQAQSQDANRARPTLEHGQYAIHVRSYIPFETVGFPLYPPYQGDNRGPSTSPSVTSRVNYVITVDFDRQTIAHSDIWADPTKRGSDTATSKPTATLVPHFVDERRVDLQFAVSARDPISPLGIPDQLVPTTDMLGSITAQFEKGTLSISATVWGDLFPSAEVFVEDAAGNRVFIASHDIRSLESVSIFTVEQMLRPDPIRAGPDGRFVLGDGWVDLSLHPDGQFLSVRRGSAHASGQNIAHVDFLAARGASWVGVETPIGTWNRQFQGPIGSASTAKAGGLNWTDRVQEATRLWESAQSEMEGSQTGERRQAVQVTEALRERANLLRQELEREKSLFEARSELGQTQRLVRGAQREALDALATLRSSPAPSPRIVIGSQPASHEKAVGRADRTTQNLAEHYRLATDQTGNILKNYNDWLNAHERLTHANNSRLAELRIASQHRSPAQHGARRDEFDQLHRDFRKQFPSGQSQFGVIERPFHRPETHSSPLSPHGPDASSRRGAGSGFGGRPFGSGFGDGPSRLNNPSDRPRSQHVAPIYTPFEARSLGTSSGANINQLPKRGYVMEHPGGTVLRKYNETTRKFEDFPSAHRSK